MQFKRVKLDEDRKSLLRYALSFYDDSDDIFPEFSFNPLSSVTDEVYNDCLRFFETNNADDNLVTFINNIIRCQTVYQFLCDKNEVSEIKINATDIPLFNTYLLESVSCSIALSKIYKMDPKTLLLYGFMRSNIYSHYVVSDKSIYKKHHKLFIKPLKKLFKEQYSFIYSNKMYGSYCNSYLN